jgi:drug/metabolite transporter (DMT)-like permease
MPLWIPIAVTAALFQSWRTALQQKLRHLLSVNGAGFVRYLYGAPMALLLLVVALWITGAPLPEANVLFVLFCIGGGLSQILATNLLIMSFGYRNFAVGTAYGKTETIQTAFIAIIFLHEFLRPLAWVGVLIGLSGVMTLSLAGRGFKPRDLLAASVQPAALCGLGAGFLFACAVVFIKEAFFALPGPSLVVRTLFGVVVTNSLQTVLQGAWLFWREPGQLRKAFASWRTSMWAGTLSACGSALWATGFALTDVALVRSVGQVELVFTLLFSRFYLRETLKRSDVAGLVLVVGGVLLIIVAH